MFKVTICDIGKMNINMTDKIEKKEATFAVPYNGEDNNDYADGEVVQHIEYVPFGEVFAEERNNIWNTPYLFNAKEFDEETGLYYYVARYYDQGWACGFLRMHYFDLGTEILDQSRQLKISGAEKITDKVIEEKDSKNNNTKDNK